MAGRQQRIDSVTEQVAVMQAAVREIEPPAHVPLQDAATPFWNSIIAEKAKAEWTAHDLEIAAMLARAMSQLEAEEAKLTREDSVLSNAGGTAMQNPRIRVIADLHARVIKYRQTLGVHSRGKSGEQRDVTKRRDSAMAIESNNPLADDLLARPSLQ